MADLLLEVYTEEIPASYLPGAVESLKTLLLEALRDERLVEGEVDVKTFYTPRRMGVFVSGLLSRQPDREEVVTGPPAEKAFDEDGRPTAMAEGFARSKGVSPGELFVVEKGKGKYCAVRLQVEGKDGAEVIAARLPAVVLGVGFPKTMWWGEVADDGTKIRFARPIRGILALFDERVVDFTLGSLKSGNVTRGHFFVTGGRRVSIERADVETYERVLHDAVVVVDPAERRRILGDRLRSLLPAECRIGAEEMVEEVADAVEYPNALAGRFDERFLRLPAEIVSEVLTSHQRYFPVLAQDGSLVPVFLACFDRPDDADVDAIREGAERVVRARLEDAEFFWDHDKRYTLEDFHRRLERISFHEKLGDYRAKAGRMVSICKVICETAGVEEEPARDALTACRYAKADLASEMVGEFPSLQGVVGALYARSEGMPEAVVRAIREQYAVDPPPTGLVGRIVAIADRVDNAIGYFRVGEQPTGSTDPHGLRRQVTSVAWMLDEMGGDGYRLRVSSLLMAAMEAYGFTDGDGINVDAVAAFFHERIRFYLSRHRGLPVHLVSAASVAGCDDVHDLRLRTEALAELERRPEWDALVELVERTYRIGKDHVIEGEVEERYLREPQERRLYGLLKEHAGELEEAFARGEYVEGSLRYLEVFGRAVHEFFDAVFVNVEDESLRRHRMLLLKKIFLLYADRVADLSVLAARGKG